MGDGVTLHTALADAGLPLRTVRLVSRAPLQVDLDFSRTLHPAEQAVATAICAQSGVQVLTPQTRGKPWVRQKPPPEPVTPDQATAPATLAGPLLTVSLHSNGIGDSILGLAIAEGLRRHWSGQVAFVGQPRHYPWLQLFGGADLLLPQPASGPVLTCDLDGYGRTSRQIPRWQWWAQQAGIEAVLPDPRPLPAAALDWAVPYAGRVALAPYAQHANRTWPLARWLEVERLLLERGFVCVILDDRPGRTEEFRSAKVLGEKPARVAAILKQADALVGNDSGLAHVAGFLRTPTVAVASRVSDAGIMDLYPTCRTLGGRGRGFESARPADVVQAVMAHARAAAGDFPAGHFAQILTPQDLWRVHAWLPVYATLWRLARRLQPRRIVEIGCRAGYSSWVFRQACPKATVHAIDADLPEDMEQASGGYKGAHLHAMAINHDRWTLQIADSHTIDRLPECDLLYIDGDHSEAGCHADLLLAERSGVPAILVDDVANCPSVRAACARFLSARPHLKWEFHPNHTGHILIQGKQ